jgi:hypothetical protein
MLRYFGRIACLSLLAGTAVVGLASSSSATTLMDTYWGGGNTYSGSPGTAYPNVSGDLIGGSDYDIFSANVQRTGAGNNTLQVTISTNYAGMAGADNLTGYGSLFFSTNIFTPTGTGPQYATDVYTPGRFNYAFVMPQNPGLGNQSGSYSVGSTVGGLFQVTENNVVLSNVNGTTTTYPTNPDAGYYFRQGQAAQYDPNGAAAVAGGSWTADALAHTIAFSIVDNGILGNDFMLYWTMTCANDIILGEVDIPISGGEQLAPVPLPAAFPLFASGLGIIGFLARRRRRKNTVAIAVA